MMKLNSIQITNPIKAGISYPIGLSVEGPAANAVGKLLMKLFEASEEFTQEANKAQSTSETQMASKAVSFISKPTERGQETVWREVNPAMNFTQMVSEAVYVSLSKGSDKPIKGVVRVVKEETIE